MADINAAQVNTQLGVAAFDDNGGAGPLVLNLSLLSGQALNLNSAMAQPLFSLMKAASDTASAIGGIRSYAPILISFLPGGKVRYIAVLVVLASLVEAVTVLGSSPLTFGGEPLTFADGQTLEF